VIAQIIQRSLESRVLVLAGAVLLLLWGGYETTRTPIDVFPDLTAPTVTIVAEAHGMAPEEVEALITFPIETAVNGASQVRRVRSSTGVGIAVIWIDFEWGADIYRARQVVAEKLQLVRSSLPQDVPAPVMAPVSSIMGEIMFIALRSDVHSTMDLKTAADWTVRRRLLAVPGVAQVVPIGGDTKQYQVSVLPERLAAFGVTLGQVADAVAATNKNSSAGFVQAGGQEYLIRGIGRTQRIHEIGETLIEMRAGQPILVRDVAEIAIGKALKRGEGAHDGRPAVVIGIQKQPGANTLALTTDLDRVMADIQRSLPAGMTLETNIFRQADFISVSIDNLMVALRDGAILIVAIVFVFLMSGRATMISLAAIPLSLVVAVIAMRAMGATINTMTLGGMAIALGALVDDAIIVVENVVRRLRENAAAPQPRPTIPVVLDATREIQGSIVFATLAIVLVFLPLFFLEGVEGRLLQPLGFAYIVSLAASLLVAVTVTPVLCAYLLPRDRAVLGGRETLLVRALKAAYAPVLRLSMRSWWLLAGTSAALLAVAVVGLLSAGRSFLPEFNEGSLTVSAVTLPGTSLAQSNELAALVERILHEQPEVVATARRTGRAELDEHAQEVNASEIDVALKMGDRSREDFLADLRRALSAVPGMNIVLGQPISHRIDHMLSGTRANIAVKVFGPDLYELRRIGQEIETIARQVPGTADVTLEQQTDIPLLTVAFRRDAIARHGLRIDDVAETLETVFVGREVSRILEGQAGFDLVVRYRQEPAPDFHAVRETLITTAAGAQVPLHALADIRRDRGPNMISRENVQRKIVVLVNVAGRDLLGVVEDVNTQVRSQVNLGPDYHIEYGGQFESATGATRTLLILGAIVVMGIFLLLYSAFRSARDAFLVMLNLPLALIGGVFGVFVSGGVLSVASIIGFITLFGIATRNGVMMIAHIRHLLEAGDESSLDAAVQRGAMERLSPILMTALATGLALVPLALSAGQPGSEIQAPMAIVILFGLLSSTVLNMVVVPAIYQRFGGARPRADHRTLEEAGLDGSTRPV